MLKANIAEPLPRDADNRREAKDLGLVGEKIAALHLEEQGYTIVETNYRCGRHEVDIIALDGDELVVVEVKTRADDALGLPQDAVDHRKRGYIIFVANQYVQTHNRRENVRFDIVSIISNNGTTEIEHIKNAFDVLCY